MYDQQEQTEQARVPYSFWIFVVNIAVFITSIIVSFILAGMGVSTKYASLVITPVLIAITLLSSGVYAGWKYRSADNRRVRLNKIGMWGNIALYAIIILCLIGSRVVSFLLA